MDNSHNAHWQWKNATVYLLDQNSAKGYAKTESYSCTSTMVTDEANIEKMGELMARNDSKLLVLLIPCRAHCSLLFLTLM